MTTIDDYPIPVSRETEPEAPTRGRLANILGGTAIGAVVMPMVMIQLTPPELTSDYMQSVLPEQMAIGGAMAFVTVSAIEAGKHIKNSLNKKG